jgi:hypothetical protein
VAFQGLEKQVNVIVHQDEGMAADTELLKIAGEIAEVFLTILIALEYVPPSVATARYMIPSARKFNSYRSSHGSKRSLQLSKSQ